MGKIVDRVRLNHRLELSRRGSEAAGTEIGAAKRLAHRGLLRRPPSGLGQGRSGVLEIAVLEQLEAATVERVGGFGGGFAGHTTKFRRRRKRAC